MADLKMYLTSLQPDMNQSIFSQSIGGYVSNSLLYPETTLASVIGLYDASFTLHSPLSGSWSLWEGLEYISINNEVMKIGSINEESVTVQQRGVNGIVAVHIEGDVVRGISSNHLFNNVFNKEYKQYRCIAIKNSSSYADPSNYVTASRLEIYIGQESRNINSKIRIAIERPSHQYIGSVSSTVNYDVSTGISTIVDDTLIGQYTSDQFRNSYLKIKSGLNNGQGRTITSFSPENGVIEIEGVISNDTAVDYEIFPSPSQRIKSGTISPVVGSNMSSFVLYGEYNPYMIDLHPGDVSGFLGNLNINDVFYIWIERSISKGSEAFENNNFLINIKYHYLMEQ